MFTDSVTESTPYVTIALFIIAKVGSYMTLSSARIGAYKEGVLLFIDEVTCVEFRTWNTEPLALPHEVVI